MKKQFSFLLVGISSLALVGFTALSGVKIMQAKGDLSNTTWKHYDAVEATYETRGIKEYWTDCIGGQPVFEKPVDVTVNEGGIPSEAFISSLAIDDSRLIPAFKEYPVLSNEHAIKYVLASDDSEVALSINDEVDNRYGNVYSFDFTTITGNKDNYAYMEVNKDDILDSVAIYIYSDTNMLVGYGSASSDGYAIKAGGWNKVKLTKDVIETASDSRFYFFSSSVDSLNKLGTIKVTNFVKDITSNDDMLTVTWKNDDGSILAIDNVKEGEIPSYKNGIPSKETSEKVYEFTGWDKEITAVNGNAIYTAQFNDGYTYKGGFININGTLNMSEQTFAGEEAVYVTGTGHIGFKGAYLPADTFFENYTYLAFDFLYRQTNTDNMFYTPGVSQWFRVDNVDNGSGFNQNFFRVYEDGEIVTNFTINHWYTACFYVRSSLDNGTTPTLKDIRFELNNSSHEIYLKNLRFGNEWMYSKFVIDPLGFEGDSSTITMEKTQKDGADVMKAVALSGNLAFLYFDGIYTEAGYQKYFMSKFNKVRFDIFVESDDGSGKYFHTTWNEWDWINFNGYVWTNDGQKGNVYSSYNSSGELINNIHLGEWITVEMNVGKSNNFAQNVCKLDIQGSTCYLKNLQVIA